MDRLNIAVLIGTTREGRQSAKVAEYVYDVVKQSEEIEAVLVDPRELNLPGDGNDEPAKDPRYSRITKTADGFVIVVPEYNHSFPGSLKRMLDSELKNYIHKPVAFVGVSSGRFAGARAIESLVPVTRELGMVPSFADVYVGNVAEAFDAEGRPTADYLEESVASMVKELVWLARTLRWGRDNLASKYHS